MLESMIMGRRESGDKMASSDVKAPKALQGGDTDDNLFGGGRSETMAGNAGNDQMYGGGGNDDMAGGVGSDLMFGDAGKGGRANMTTLKVAESVTGTVTFQSESAGYKNALGVYKIAADGTIYDADVIWANASLKGSGGDLVSGKSSAALELKAGERLGFFVVPDGYSQSGMAKLLDDAKGSWKFVDAKGNAGNVNGGQEVKLVHVASNGKETDIKSTYGTSVFHSVDDGSKGLNGDKLNHVVANVDATTGTLKIGFEDLKGGGDKDFDDSVFTLNIGTTNAALTSKIATKVAGEKNDVMDGGAGNDKMFGMSGHDTVAGGAGDDKLWGNSGNDVLKGGDGNDVMSGGSGEDVLEGGAGDDVMSGNSGNDVMLGGDGNDAMSGNTGDDKMAGGEGNDSLDGGTGNDTFVSDAGNDSYKGGAGFDTLDYSGSGKGIELDLSKHTAVGAGNDQVWGVERVVGSSHDDVMKGDKDVNALVGGAGDDVLRGLGGADVLTGGEGRDTFQWLAKDVVDAKGNHLGIDVVTDFSKEDVLDFSKLFKGADANNVDDFVKVVDDGKSSHVFAAIGGEWHEVATLEGFTGVSASAMAHDGMILV